MKVVAVSGNFDPVHVGHLHLIKKARFLGNKLIVILTRDEQCIIKKGYAFMPYEERKEVLESVRWVDKVVENIDSDISSRESLKKYLPNIYARGGDSLDKDNLIETEVCRQFGIQIVTGVGGIIKEQSSSMLVKSSNRVICIDIDGVLCTNGDNSYDTHQPLQENIDKVNRLYAMGNEIKLYTARGTTSGKDWRGLTERQLAEWGVKYNELLMGKPSYDVFVDDKNAKLSEL